MNIFFKLLKEFIHNFENLNHFSRIKSNDK